MYVRTLQHYSALKMDEIVVQAVVWMNLEHVTASEGNQTQIGQMLQDATHATDLPDRRIHREQKWNGDGQGLGGWPCTVITSWVRSSVWHDE